MSNSKKDRELIFNKLLEALTSEAFLNMEELIDASPERRTEFMNEKRRVREELQDLAKGIKPKAKKSTFSTARYKTHDGEKGNPEQWREAAKVILNVNDENCLTTLGLTGVPTSEAILKTAWRAAVRLVHPDLGGSEDEAARVNAAYELALALFFTKPKTTKAGRQDTGLRPQLLTPITEDESVKYLTNDLWCIQEKMDGKHGILKKVGDRVIAANKQGLEMSIPKVVEDAVLNLPDVVIDGELIGNKFYIFDLLEHGSLDYRQYPYAVRHERLKSLLPKDDFLIVVPAYMGTKAKTDFYYSIKTAEKEGVVFKKLDAVWKEGRPEVGGDMVKCKFWATLSAIVDSEDTGKTSFISYVLDPNGKRVYLGKCTALGKVMPVAGDIVELRYLYAYPGGKLIQQNLLGIRDDVAKEECTTKQLKFKKE